MKSILSFSLLTILIISCETSTGIENPQLSMSIADESQFTISERARYMEDAYTFALRDMRINDPEYLEKTEIDEDLVYIYYNALLHLSSNEEIMADTSWNSLNFHCAYLASRTIQISADSSVAWFKNINRNIHREEAKDLLNLMIQFQLEHSSYLDFTHVSHWRVKSRRIYNLHCIASKIEQIAGLSAGVLTFTNKWYGMNADIGDGFVNITKWVGVGDCLSGCPHHEWHLKVGFDGSVEFIGEEGAPIN